MSRVCAALLVCVGALVAGCRFRSSIDVEVQVYRGDVMPVAWAPDPYKLMEQAIAVSSATDEAFDELEEYQGSGREALDKVKSGLDALEVSLISLKDRKEYVDYVVAYSRALALVFSSETQGAGAAIDKLKLRGETSPYRKLANYLISVDLTQLIADHANAPEKDVSAKWVQVGDVISHFLLPDEDGEGRAKDASDKDVKDLRSDLAGVIEELRTHAAGLTDGSMLSDAFLNRVEAYIAEYVARERKLLDPFEAAVDTIPENSADPDKIGWQVLREARRDVHSAGDLVISWSDVVLGVASDTRSAQEVATRSPSQVLVEAYMKLLRQFRAFRTLVSTAATGINERLLQTLRERRNSIASTAEEVGVSEIDINAVEAPPAKPLDDVLQGLQRLEDAAAGLIDEISDAAITEYGARNTMEGGDIRPIDPNLKLITDPNNEEKWGQPINRLFQKSEGKAQYIIVQDTPRSYRAKETHVDPTQVVGLQGDMMEVGIDLLARAATAAAAAYGISIPKPGKSDGGDAATTEHDAVYENQIRLLEDKLESARSQTLRALKGLQASNGTLVDGADKRAEGILKAYQAKVRGIRNEAARLLGETAASGEGK